MKWVTLRLAVPAAFLGLLTACVTPPPPRVYRVPAPPPPPQRLFVYPANGQSPEQTERDRYECHVWAVQQTGVDPSRPGSNTYQAVVVQPSAPAPGSGVAGGAVAGAIIGSIIGGPWHAATGLLLGGATGAVIGGAAEASATQNAQAQAQQAQQQINQSNAQVRAGADAYRQAIGSCLQGRGYTVS